MKEIRIKANANCIYELSNTGNIKAKDIMEVLFKEPLITKKKDNVVESIENCLYDGYEIDHAMYDMLVNEICLFLKDQPYRICPKCGFGYSDHPAISREDNETEICPRCGVKEALEDFNDYK